MPELTATPPGAPQHLPGFPLLAHLGLMLGLAQLPSLRDPRSPGILHEAKGSEKGEGQGPASCLWELLRSPGAGLDPVQLHVPAAGHPAPEASGSWSANLFQASATPKAKAAHRGSVGSTRSCGLGDGGLPPARTHAALPSPGRGRAGPFYGTPGVSTLSS